MVKLLKILQYPDERLFQVAEPVELEGLPGIKFFIDSMIYTMQRHEGLGLAAPQIEINERYIVWRKNINDPPLYAINPVIMSARGKNKPRMLEGCLSIPNIQRQINRRKRVVVVEAIDENNNPISFNLENESAVIVQHEIDHLNGITILSQGRYGKNKDIFRDRER